MIKQNVWKALAASAGLLLAGLSGTASATEEEGFHVWADPIDLWVLEKDIDTESSKFEEYRDLGSGLRPTVKLFGESADGDRTLKLRLDAIGRDDARYRLDYRLEGSYALTIDYNQIPHRFGNDGVSLWARPEPDVLTIPDSLQGIGAGEIDALLAEADRIDLGLRRDRTRARFDLGKMGRMAWAFEYTHENRVGDRPLGASFGFGNAQEIPEPIDFDTTGVEMSGELNLKKGGLRFGYRYSVFENNHDAVVWDNIFSGVDSVNNPTRGRLDLAPDNKANLLYVDGRVKTDRWWFNGNLVYDDLTQDDALLPYTINPAIQGEDPTTGATFPADSAGLPVSRADNEARILNFSANAGTDLGRNWGLTLRYRYYDYDNQSPRIVFPGYVRMDSIWTDEQLRTVPFSYSRNSLGAEVSWNVAKTTDLRLSYTLESWDRNFREIETSDEDILKLSLDSRPSDKVTVRGSWATGRRTTSEYDVEAQEVFFVHPAGPNNLPDLRKFDEAERDVDDYELAVQIFPSDRWNLSLGLSGRDEDYPDSRFGLASDEIVSYSFELGYTPNDSFTAYLFGHGAAREVLQRARQSGARPSTNPQDDWTALLNEDTNTLGLGLTATNDSGWTLDLSAQLSDSDGEGDFETPPGGSPSAAVDFDNYEDIELLSVWLKLDYEVSEKFSVGLFYLYEDYTIDSFIQQGVQPFLAGTLLLVPNDGDYQANVFGGKLRFAF